MSKRILCNKARCKICGDIIESVHVHDYKTCKCGKIAVDGGKEYLKRMFPSFPYQDWFEDLSVSVYDCSKCNKTFTEEEACRVIKNTEGNAIFCCPECGDVVSYD